MYVVLLLPRAKTTSSSSRRSLASCEAEDFEDDLADVGRNADLYLLYLYSVRRRSGEYRFIRSPSSAYGGRSVYA